MRAALTVFFLIISNTFMTLAWYGHLKFKEMAWSKSLGLVSIIAISWGIALFEYIFQVPANKFGFKENGGAFSLMQLKVTQEAISITVFLIFTILFFKTEKIAWNHIVAFCLILLAVFFAFIKK
ncbi:DMT family protein [Pedobacter lithocola]|uniref:DMT family protein n=1 Tax=Pedobacter lithocola TaxID=1908239 RepID=A0ABV8PB65_9SPHI